MLDVLAHGLLSLQAWSSQLQPLPQISHYWLLERSYLYSILSDKDGTSFWASLQASLHRGAASSSHPADDAGKL